MDAKWKVAGLIETGQREHNYIVVLESLSNRDHRPKAECKIYSPLMMGQWDAVEAVQSRRPMVGGLSRGGLICGIGAKK